MKKYLQLAEQIFRNGTLRSSGQDFHAAREESLKNLREFVPPHVSVNLQEDGPARSTQRSGSTVIRQAAFFKHALLNDGGHLTAETLNYIRIPKAANTSISYAMLLKKYPGLKEKNPDDYQINFLTDVNLLPSVKAETGTFFTVVRNPFARLVSVYRDFFEANHTDFIYADYLFGILPQKISFAEFVSRISRIPDRLKDQHFRPQHLFVKPYESKGIAVNFFQLEGPLLKSFLNEHGMELTHRNKNQDDYNYTQYYSADLVQKVYTIYETDIKKFGYQQLHAELKRHF